MEDCGFQVPPETGPSPDMKSRQRGEPDPMAPQVRIKQTSEELLIGR